MPTPARGEPVTGSDGVARWTLAHVAPLPDQVPWTRQQVLAVLRAWHLDDLAWAAGLLLTELVTNAVRHARTPFDVGLALTGRALRCEVRDGDPHVPSPREPADPEATGGRGLVLVETVARRWGVETYAWGKAVWFEIVPD